MTPPPGASPSPTTLSDTASDGAAESARPDHQIAVEFHDVSKSFGTKAAVSGLSMDVAHGTVTMLLGPNGAGKTTAIRMMTGSTPFDEGTVTVFGLNHEESGEEIRRRCGIVPANPALYDQLSGLDNLKYAARLYGLGKAAKNEIAIAAERFEIHESLSQMVAGYSTGMKSRLALARAVLHRPDLLLLDEPTSGLDPESAYAVLQMIRDFTREGTTVVMSTHLLPEAEGLADQIVMLEAGSMLLSGSQAALIARYWPTIYVHFDAEEPAGLDVLSHANGVRSYQRTAHAIVEVASPAVIPDLVALLASRGVRITRVEEHVPSLEELYFHVRREHRRRTGTPAPALVTDEAAG